MISGARSVVVYHSNPPSPAFPQLDKQCVHVPLLTIHTLITPSTGLPKPLSKHCTITDLYNNRILLTGILTEKSYGQGNT